MPIHEHMTNITKGIPTASPDDVAVAQPEVNEADTRVADHDPAHPPAQADPFVQSQAPELNIANDQPGMDTPVSHSYMGIPRETNPFAEQEAARARAVEGMQISQMKNPSTPAISTAAIQPGADTTSPFAKEFATASKKATEEFHNSTASGFCGVCGGSNDYRTINAGRGLCYCQPRVGQPAPVGGTDRCVIINLEHLDQTALPGTMYRITSGGTPIGKPLGPRESALVLEWLASLSESTPPTAA